MSCGTSRLSFGMRPQDDYSLYRHGPSVEAASMGKDRAPHSRGPSDYRRWCRKVIWSRRRTCGTSVLTQVEAWGDAAAFWLFGTDAAKVCLSRSGPGSLNSTPEQEECQLRRSPQNPWRVSLPASFEPGGHVTLPRSGPGISARPAAAIKWICFPFAGMDSTQVPKGGPGRRI